MAACLRSALVVLCVGGSANPAAAQTAGTWIEGKLVSVAPRLVVVDDGVKRKFIVNPATTPIQYRAVATLSQIPLGTAVYTYMKTTPQNGLFHDWFLSAYPGGRAPQGRYTTFPTGGIEMFVSGTLTEVLNDSISVRIATTNPGDYAGQTIGLSNSNAGTNAIYRVTPSKGEVSVVLDKSQIGNDPVVLVKVGDRPGTASEVVVLRTEPLAPLPQPAAQK